MKPFQGVTNIIKFNWHFYVIAILGIIFLLILSIYFQYPLKHLMWIASGSIILTTFVSLFASWYVYDHSRLYDFRWLNHDQEKHTLSILNVNAGFDETSSILEKLFGTERLSVYDFYDPALHTEVSIKRARKAYPPHPNTIAVSSNQLPSLDNTYDKIICFLSAHEIRNDSERENFFKELSRILKPDGSIYIVEHLRDTNNFLAYTIGFFHFHSEHTWRSTFENTGLQVIKHEKLNPLISLFKVSKDGVTP